MAQTPTGIEVPAGGDPFDPQVDLVKLARSLGARIIVPVPNVAARTDLVTRITADAGAPSPASPLYVSRADAPRGVLMECTQDGATWMPIGGDMSNVGVWTRSVVSGTGQIGSDSMTQVSTVPGVTYSPAVGSPGGFTFEPGWYSIMLHAISTGTAPVTLRASQVAGMWGLDGAGQTVARTSGEARQQITYDGPITVPGRFTFDLSPHAGGITGVALRCVIYRRG